MIALIDGDIVVYQAACRAETETDWGDDDVSIIGSKPETEASIDTHIARIKVAVGADRVLMFFTDANNFRKQVFADYKSNRTGKRKPVTFKHGKAYAKKRYDSMTRPGLEADDLLAILSTGNVKAFQGPKVVCSIDKDMLTFPGLVYNWGPKHRDKGVVTVDRFAADVAFYQQILTGDAVDGYPGCPGVGPKTAAKLMHACTHDGDLDAPIAKHYPPVLDKAKAWEIIVKAYAKKDLTETHAIAQARCARILRASDYDFATKSPILWTPTKGTA